MGHEKPASALIVLGDDSLFGSDTRVNLKYLAKILAKAGLTLSVEKSRHDVHFLGGIWERLEKKEDPINIATRIAYPERFRSYPNLNKGRSRSEVDKVAMLVVYQYLTVWKDS